MKASLLQPKRFLFGEYSITTGLLQLNEKSTQIKYLLAKFEEPKRCKRGIIGILFKAIVGIALEAVSAFIR